MHVWNPKLGFVSVVHRSICNALPSTAVLGGTRVNARREAARDPVEIEFNVRLRRENAIDPAGFSKHVRVKSRDIFPISQR